jgi:threonine/homoserine/homoserine lactone efflux protein
MDLALYFRGLALGFAIAAPVGPIGLLVIQRTLNQGRTVGLVSGLGAATADALYGAVAALGLTLITAFLVEQQLWLGLIGGAFLCYLGVRTLLAAPAAHAAQSEARSLGSAFGTTFVLTLTNPMTILAFVAIFAGAGLAAASGDIVAALLLVAGVFSGSALWWLLLSTGTAFLRRYIESTGLRWVNRVAGAIIVGFGVAAIVRTMGNWG